jgi:hypothetical protein
MPTYSSAQSSPMHPHRDLLMGPLPATILRVRVRGTGAMTDTPPPVMKEY